MATKESLKMMFYHATDFTNKAQPKLRILAAGTSNTVNENSDIRKILRSVIAGVVTMTGTLAALGATGLVKDPVTGCVANLISFLFGFGIRLGAEYGITATPPPKPTG